MLRQLRAPPALYRIDGNGAFAQTRASEARCRPRAPHSALDGVPVTLKESLYARGDPAPIGARANEDAGPMPRGRPARVPRPGLA